MCRDTYRAVNKPRQCGISTIAAAEVAWEFCNVPGAQIVIVSKDKDAAVNFHTYVYQILRSVRVNDPNFPRLIKENERQTTNVNGSKITSLAAGAETGRSFSATHLIFDEMAFAQYADDIWQAASPTLSRTNGRATVISTPKGRANLFAQIFDEPGHLGFTIFDFKWWDVPDYNPFYDKMVAAVGKYEKDAWIEKAKSGDWYKKNRPSKTDLSWRQEFEGAFDANEGSVFSTRSLERIFKKNWLQKKEDPQGFITEWWSSGKQDDRIYATGIDLGRKNDPTVIMTYDITDYDPEDRDEKGRFLSPAPLVDYKWIEPGTLEWSELNGVCKAHLEYWRPDAEHDGTGAGDSASEDLEGLSEAVAFTAKTKTDIVSRIQHAFDYGAVRLPKISRLYREHQKYVFKDEGIMQDTVMANGLAIDIFYTANDGVFTGFIKAEIGTTV